MKVLFIASHSYDYLQDIVFSGLIKTLGLSRVHHWKANPKFIFPIKEYPKNLGFHPQAWRTATIFKPRPDNYDVILIGACKPDAFDTYLSIAQSIPQSVPVVLLDGGDREEIGGDLARLGRMDLYIKAKNARDFDWIFKREYFQDKQYESNVRPLPFGFNLTRLPKLTAGGKKYDVTFWAVESHPIRTQALQLLQDKFDCAQNGTTPKQTFSNYKRKGGFYLQELEASKITLNFRGGGWDTLRYWEVPAVGGFMISQKPAIHIPYNFEHNKHVVFCGDDIADLMSLCTYYITHDSERESIAQAARKHLHTYHTDTARAQTVLQTITKSDPD